MNEYVTQSEFARRLGVSQPAVNKAIKNGRIEARKDGKINFNTEFDKWFANKDISKVRDNDNHKPDEMSSLSKAKLAKETFVAKLRQLEFERESGKLVPKDEVQTAVFKFCRVLRDNILTIPDRVAAETAAAMAKAFEKELKKHISKNKVDEIFKNIDTQELERIIHRIWDKESRDVLEDLKEGPEI